ncbi:hypothetical protein [Paracoccus mutanolyticus]|uniref:hypothetical protein n=1 Tax=Paracoccus mutanolyticus TaxID=1499308 RepID=UPI0011AE295F
MLAPVIGAMLKARAALWAEFTRLHREMLKISRADPVCRRLTRACPASELWCRAFAAIVRMPGSRPSTSTAGQRVTTASLALASASACREQACDAVTAICR